MGAAPSTHSSSPSPTNPIDVAATTTMPPSNTQLEPVTEPESPKSVPVTAELSDPLPPAKNSSPESVPGAQESSDPPTENPVEAAAEGEEEEEECGFCLFMKAGGCKEEFIAWEKCVEEGDRDKEDIVEKCFELTSNLKKCMEAHPEHYGPLLEAEKVAHEQARKEIDEEEAAAAAAGGSDNGGAAAEVKIAASEEGLASSSDEKEKSQEGA